MGQKVHPTSFRLGYIKTWNSLWYASKKDFAKFLHEDLKIRKHGGITKSVTELT